MPLNKVVDTPVDKKVSCCDLLLNVQTTLMHMPATVSYINYRNVRLGINQMQLQQIANANTYVLDPTMVAKAPPDLLYIFRVLLYQDHSLCCQKTTPTHHCWCVCSTRPA